MLNTIQKSGASKDFQTVHSVPRREEEVTLLEEEEEVSREINHLE